MRKAYEVVTDRIISLLEKGTAPWHRPWGGQAFHPRNLASGRMYRGVNVFVLASTCYGSPYWLTFRQAKERGGHVQRGEKGFPCVFWNWVEKANPETGKMEKHPFLKYYTVFNAEQCEGVDYPKPELPSAQHDSIEECERVVAEMPCPPSIRDSGKPPCYAPRTDTVHMPALSLFESAEEYYSALFHELSHSTGHESRLSRRGVVDMIEFGSSQYSKEELTAEMAATYLCGHTGIENKVIDNSAAYISGWLKRLRSDSHLVVLAAAKAQKAADYILDRSQETAEKETPNITRRASGSSAQS